MKIKEIENLLRTEADRVVPDRKEELRARLGYRRAPVGESPRRARKRYGWIAAPIAAVVIAAVVLTLVLALPGGGGSGGGGTPAPQPFTESVVRVDINPSVRFSVGKDGLVTAQTACNKDGALLLLKRDFVGRGIGDAAAEVVALAAKYGFLTDGDGKTVELKVLNDDSEIETELLTALGARVEAELAALPFKQPVAYNSAGKNDLVDYLVERGYARKDAEKLSSDDLEDILEELFEDEDDEELEDYTAELASGMTGFLAELTNRCSAVISMLREVEADGGGYPLSSEARKSVKEYVEKFAFDADIDFRPVLEEEEFEELLEAFEDELKDAEESLAELSEKPEDGDDVSEDWYDRYKVYLKKTKKTLDISTARVL